MQWQDSLYEKNVEYLGLANLSSSERVHAFMDTPALELLDKLPFVQYFVGTTGTKFLAEPVNTARLSDPKDSYGKPAWCREIVLGNTLHDVRPD